MELDSLREKLAKTQASARRSENLAKLGTYEWNCIDDELTACSELYARMHEMTVDEALQIFTHYASDYNFVHPDDREKVYKIEDEAVAKGAGFTAEYRLLLPSGRIRYIREVTDAELNEQGKLVRLLGTLQDVTEHVLAQEKIAESLANARRAEKLVQLGTYEWDATNHTLAACSEEYARIHEMSVEEALQFFTSDEADRSFIHPEDRERCTETEAEALARGEGYTIDYRMVLPSGRITYINETCEAEIDDRGNVVRTLGTVQDITEKKLAEEARKQSEAEFKALWETAADCMITVNSEGIITLVNSMIEEMFGYDRQELIGQSIEILVPESVRESHSRLRLNYLAGPYKRAMGEAMELNGLRKDGGKFPVQISLTPFTLKGRQEILTSIQDISTRKLSEEKLRQSQKLTAVGQLAGGIAHDLNNILTAMTGFTELAQLKLDDDHPSVTDLKHVLEGGERAKGLISKMLAFSSQQVLDPKLLNINDEISEMQAMLQQLIGNDIKLTLKLHPKLNLSYLDQSQLGQIIVNLVVNSSDAMPDGGNIFINTNNVELDEDSLVEHQVDEPGLYTELTVSDSGEGISHEVLKRIFEPFYTTKERGKGTGLGLATVYGVVKQSKGEIVVFSESGTGTTFKIYFPVAESRIIANQKTSAKSPLAKGNKSIVLVDDDEAVLLLTKRILESNGYTVYAVDSAEKALKMISSLNSVELVLTDIVLAGMSGVELGKTLKASHPEIPVIYMSGFAGDALENLNERDDDSLFISKPFTQKALLQKVEQHLQ